MPFDGDVPGLPRRPAACRIHHLALGLGLVAGWACSDSGAPGGSPGEEGDAAGLVLVSSPLTLPGVAALSGATEFVYVSAPPGSASPAAHVVLTNSRTSESVGLRLTTGGFDPVRLGAVDGDQVRVKFGDGSTGSVLVKKRPPRVVRSSVGPNQTDVPLNVVIEVVFSAPVSRESVRDAVRLTRASGELVPSVAVFEGEPFVVQFHAVGLLAPTETYVLEIGAGVQDLAGVALAEPVSVPFSTGTSLGTGTPPPPPPPAPMDTVPLEAADCCPTGRYGTTGHWFGIEPGTTMVFQAVPLGSVGQAIVFGSSASNVADGEAWRDAGRLTVTGRAPGRTLITVLASEVLGRAEILVYRTIPIPVEAQYRVAGIDTRDRLASSLLDGSQLQVLNDTITDAYAWGAMRAGRLVFSRRSGGIFLRDRQGVITRIVGTLQPARCVTASHDGAWVAWVAPAPGSGGEALEQWSIMVARMDGSSARELVPNRPSHVCPTWSANGRLVYRDGLSTLRAIQPDGGGDLPFLTSADNRILLPSEWSWGLDRRLVVHGYSLQVANGDGGNRTDLHTYGLGARVSWSADGRYLLAQTVEGEATGGLAKRMLVSADGLSRTDLLTISLTLRDAGFVPW